MTKNETLAALCDKVIDGVGTKPSLTRTEVVKLLAGIMSEAYDSGFHNGSMAGQQMQQRASAEGLRILQLQESRRRSAGLT